jgi:hypothetical protein
MRMKKAEIYPVAAGHSPGYAWKWRCATDKTQCKHAFLLYYDCVADAKKQGYLVELTQAKRTDL